jgi:hypothetical protein
MIDINEWKSLIYTPYNESLGPGCTILKSGNPPASQPILCMFGREEE